MGKVTRRYVNIMNGNRFKEIKGDETQSLVEQAREIGVDPAVAMELGIEASCLGVETTKELQDALRSFHTEGFRVYLLKRRIRNVIDADEAGRGPNE